MAYKLRQSSVSRQYREHDTFVAMLFTDECQPQLYPSSYQAQCRLKEAVFGVNLNNIFNRHYAASGWVYSSILDNNGHPNENRYTQIGFIPMAGFNMMGSVAVKF